jgi:hypothetical protein
MVVPVFLASKCRFQKKTSIILNLILRGIDEAMPLHTQIFSTVLSSIQEERTTTTAATRRKDCPFSPNPIGACGFRRIDE